MSDTVNDNGWSVTTIFNDKATSATVSSREYAVRSLVQKITAPDGSKILLEQLLENNGDFHDITIRIEK